MLLLAGDVGGTSARLAYCRVQDEKVEVISKQVYPSRQFGGLVELIRKFMSVHSEVADAACFSIAGPVRSDHVVTPNLGWVVDAGDLSHRLSIRNVHVINDLEANAYGIPSLEPSDQP